MPLLTKRSIGLGNGYCSGYKRYELIDKLGGIEYKAPELAEQICDDICRHRDVEDQQDLDDLCEVCPLKQMMDLIE